MSAVRKLWVEPPWREDEATADLIWRTIISSLGPGCDELWLRYGNLEDLKVFLSRKKYLRLEELVGPYWGQPDPIRRTLHHEADQSVLGGLLQGLADDFGQAGFSSAETQRPRYAPYGCAVVPMTPALLDFVINLRTSHAQSIREMLSRLSDHWHFRREDRDVISTNDGMTGISLNLTPEEVGAVQSRLLATGLSPMLLVER